MPSFAVLNKNENVIIMLYAFSMLLPSNPSSTFRSVPLNSFELLPSTTHLITLLFADAACSRS